MIGRAIFDSAAGDLGAAREGCQKVLQWWQEAGLSWFTAVQAMVGGFALAQGDWPAARKELDGAVASALVGSFGGFEEAHLLLLLSYSGDSGAAALLRAFLVSA